MKEAPGRHTASAGRNDRVRAFFALPIVGAQHALLSSEIARLRQLAWGRDVRWVREEGLHVTLRFLGDVERRDAGAVADAVGEAVASFVPFETRFGKLEIFPSMRRPRAIAAALAANRSLDALVRRIEVAVVARGFDAESHAFRGHVTLGRFRDRGRRIQRLEGSLDPAPARADAVVLYQSELGRGGARYDELARLPLLGEGAR